MQHPFFGTLDPDAEAPWSQDRSVAGATVATVLWAGRGLDAASLDGFAALLGDLEGADRRARVALTDHLHRDPSFLNAHLEHVEMIPSLAQAARDGVVTVEEFVAALRLTSLGLWCGTGAVLDYQVDPRVSDQILAVKLGVDGALRAIDWESRP